MVRALGTLGIGGWRIWTPIPEKKHCDPAWHRQFARSFADKIQRNPAVEEIEVDGVKAKRYGESPDPLWFTHFWCNTAQPIAAAGHALASILHNKREQLDVEGHSRVLLLTPGGFPVQPDDLANSCAFIDTREFCSTDLIFYEFGPNNFELIFDRAAFEAVRAFRLPEGVQERALAVGWIEAQMTFKWPTGLSAALEISWDRGGRDWLTDSGRQIMEIEGQRFLSECPSNALRDYWRTRGGELSAGIDARPAMRPIGLLSRGDSGRGRATFQERGDVARGTNDRDDFERGR